MDIDHIFIRAKFGAPEGDLLCQFGLSEGSGNKHPGQGTENRRFFFRNAFIELLWISDQFEIQSSQTRPTRLYERLAGVSAAASPFGVCFRAPAGESVCPFPTWKYTPGYLPDGMAIELADQAPLAEPMWFFLGTAAAPDTAPVERRQPLDHPAKIHAITSVAITLPSKENWSEAAMAAIETGKVSIVEGTHHLIEISFDNEISGLRHDFRPALPVVFKY